ncbi:diaminobutyrate--2-oxoglutarate transaminase [Phytomonospora sp. NPDC050363]|uniref:diaminobutyrate--2-oxoglutarate transaminase n=1 Tax=Phytomonospora sp. NPDC050363 TaxID=3155642 RepID=UPI0033C750D0
MRVFEETESQVRSYCRGWPAVFVRSKESHIYDESGKPYLDFFAGAGALNYGHNHPVLKNALIEYLTDDHIVHSLDMYTEAKAGFLETFRELILRPRGLDHKVQFPGPTGTNAVEAALKIARKFTGRTTIARFTNSFHGMTLGSLAVTGNGAKRHGAGVPLEHTLTLPFDQYLDGSTPDLLWLRRLIEDSSSGVGLPAAVIVETVQGEGGINVASPEWLRALAKLCEEHAMLLIVDDVQMGCGRTGPFFSFEEAGVVPDIVCLSKSLSGYGLPFAVTLLKPELDIWEPGEHNGTFRGFNPAFVTATAALEEFWRDTSLHERVAAHGSLVDDELRRIAAEHPDAGTDVRGRGLARALSFDDPMVAGVVCRNAFERGLLLETAGSEDEVVKLLPPLTTSREELETGLSIVGESVRAARKELA